MARTPLPISMTTNPPGSTNSSPRGFGPRNGSTQAVTRCTPRSARKRATSNECTALQPRPIPGRCIQMGAVRPNHRTEFARATRRKSGRAAGRALRKREYPSRAPCSRFDRTLRRNIQTAFRHTADELRRPSPGRPAFYETARSSRYKQGRDPPAATGRLPRESRC